MIKSVKKLFNNTRFSSKYFSNFLRLASVILVIIAILGILFISNFRVNLTKSAPVGLYRVSAERPKRLDRVVFCLAPENPYLALAASRGYVKGGICPSGHKPLLKRLLGVSGDVLWASRAGVWVNGRLLAGSAWSPRDSEGRAMPGSLLVWGKETQIKPGQALVMSDGAELGFDSRYFGLADERSLAKVTEILIF